MLAAVALASAHPAQAAKPACWKQVISDWIDNERIDKVYPLHCYNEAIAHVPEDLRVYSSIVSDISAARQHVLRTPRLRQMAAHEQRSGKTQTPPVTNASQPSQALFKEAFNKIGPRNADSVPLPLLILGGLSLMMIAAGAAGLVSRRLRTRRAGP